MKWFCATEKLPRPTEEMLKAGLLRHLVYKPGVTVNKFETRKKTTMNSYLRNGKVVTLR